tara:strand:- start:193 stop:789 length:597 start_codon:yes stop_codon:yes gene_type:complete
MKTSSSGGRTTCVCDMNSMVPILDLICGILLCVSCFFSFISFGGVGFQYFLIWLWGIFFGVTMIFLALCVPQYITQWFPFMQVFWGKGLFIILGGCLVGNGPPWYLQFVTFIYCMVLGFGYIIAHFFCGGAGPMPFMRGGGGGGHSVSRTTTRTTTSHAPASRGGGGGLPAGWKSAIDKQSGQTYYVHRSGQTQWQRP